AVHDQASRGAARLRVLTGRAGEQVSRRPAGVGLLLEGGCDEARVPLGVRAHHLLEELQLAAEGVVEAWRGDPHRGAELPRARALEAPLPEQQHRLLQSMVAVEAARSTPARTHGQHFIALDPKRVAFV